jgi:hypothetical protein
MAQSRRAGRRRGSARRGDSGRRLTSESVATVRGGGTHKWTGLGGTVPTRAVQMVFYRIHIERFQTNSKASKL